MLSDSGPGAPGPGADVNMDADARLVLLERRVAAQVAAMAQLPPGEPLPGHVVALLATVPRELDGADLPERYRPRLVKLVADLQTMIDDITLRERELARRMANVCAARRGGLAPHLFDYAG